MVPLYEPITLGTELVGALVVVGAVGDDPAPLHPTEPIIAPAIQPASTILIILITDAPAVVYDSQTSPYSLRGRGDSATAGILLHYLTSKWSQDLP